MGLIKFLKDKYGDEYRTYYKLLVKNKIEQKNK